MALPSCPVELSACCPILAQETLNFLIRKLGKANWPCNESLATQIKKPYSKQSIFWNTLSMIHVV